MFPQLLSVIVVGPTLQISVLPFGLSLSPLVFKKFSNQFSNGHVPKDTLVGLLRRLLIAEITAQLPTT